MKLTPNLEMELPSSRKFIAAVVLNFFRRKNWYLVPRFESALFTANLAGLALMMSPSIVKLDRTVHSNPEIKYQFFSMYRAGNVNFLENCTT